MRKESNRQPEALRKVRQSRFIGRGFVPEAVVSRSERVGLAGAFKGNNILDSSADPLCLFVIPGSCDRCDFVVWFPLIHRQKQTTKKHKTNPHEGRKSDESSMLLPLMLLPLIVSDRDR